MDNQINTLKVFIPLITAGFVCIVTDAFIYKKLIPYIVNEYFVDNSYHKNKLENGDKICSNFEKDSLIVLLPSGEVSVAEKKIKV